MGWRLGVEPHLAGANGSSVEVSAEVASAVAAAIGDAAGSLSGPTTLWVPHRHPLFDQVVEVETRWAELPPPETDHPGWPERFDERYLLVVRPGADGSTPEVRNLLRIAGSSGLGEDGLFALPTLDHLIAAHPDEVTGPRLVDRFAVELGIDVGQWQSIECSLRLGPGPRSGRRGDADEPDLTLLGYLELALDAEERSARAGRDGRYLLFADMNRATVRSLERFGVRFDPVLGDDRPSTWCRWIEGRYVATERDGDYRTMWFRADEESSSGFAALRPARLPTIHL